MLGSIETIVIGTRLQEPYYDKKKDLKDRKDEIIDGMVDTLITAPIDLAVSYVLSSVLSTLVPVQLKPMAKVATFVGCEAICICCGSVVAEHYGEAVKSLILDWREARTSEEREEIEKQLVDTVEDFAEKYPEEAKSVVEKCMEAYEDVNTKGGD